MRIPNKIIFFSLLVLTPQAYCLDFSLINHKEAKIFAKCYHQFTRHPIPHNHPELTHIKNKTKTGTNACHDLIDSVVLTHGTTAQGLPKDELTHDLNVQNLSILKTFNDLHRSWFPDQSFLAVETQNSLGDFYDSGEPAYYYTRSLFSENEHYQNPRSILNGKKRLHAIRVDENLDSYTRSKYYVHESRRNELGGGEITEEILGFGAVACKPNSSKELNNHYLDFYKAYQDLLDSKSNSNVKDKLLHAITEIRKLGEDPNRCISASIMDEIKGLGSKSINSLGILIGFEEREIILDKNDYLYNSDIHYKRFAGLYQYDSGHLTGARFPFFKYVHPDQKCEKPFHEEGKDSVPLPIKRHRCQDTYAVISSDSSRLPFDDILALETSLNTEAPYPYVESDNPFENQVFNYFEDYKKKEIVDELKVRVSENSIPWDLSGNMETGTNRDGAGALGTMSYFILNANNTKPHFHNGFGKVNRRWAQHAISDFLCRELPVIGAEDVVATGVMSKDLNNISGVPGFRQDSVCMTCHVTMDLAARTIRNVSFENMLGSSTAQTSGEFYTEGAYYHSPYIELTPAQIHHEKPTTSLSNLESTTHKDFWEGPISLYPYTEPKGKFAFRDFIENEFIYEDIIGVSGLAKKFLETNDFYGCIAKRYLEYLTSYSIEMKRPNPIEDSGKNLDQKNLESFHQDLTTYLKGDGGTLKGLIKRIVSSKYFYEEIQ